MPTKVPKAGTRRSGQGNAAGALNKPIVKNFDPPRQPFLTGAGGSPSSAADTTASQIMQQHYPEEDSYTGGEDVLLPHELDYEPEYGCNGSYNCRQPPGDNKMATEALLRNCIREMSLNEFDLSAAAKDGAHLALDACGIIADMTGAGAAVGAGCDAVNAASYAIEGKYLLSALSLISIIPIIGDLVGKGTKFGLWATKTFPKASAKVAKHGPDIIAQISRLKTVIDENKEMIEFLFDSIPENENLKKLHPHMPKIKEALGVFMAESYSEKTDTASTLKQSQLQSEASQRFLTTLLFEAELIDEDEEELEEEPVDEFSSMAGGAVQGYTGPLGAKPPKVGNRKRKKPGTEVKGFKATHG